MAQPVNDVVEEGAEEGAPAKKGGKGLIIAVVCCSCWAVADSPRSS